MRLEPADPRSRVKHSTTVPLRFCKMEKVLKYFCKKGTPPKEIHENFVETLWEESLSYSTVKKWAAEFKGGGGGALMMMDGPAASKMTPVMKMSRSCIPWLCVLGGETCEA